MPHRWKTPAWGNGCVGVHDTATHHAVGRTVCATPQHKREKRQKTPPTPTAAVTVCFILESLPIPGSLPFCPRLRRPPPMGGVLGRGGSSSLQTRGHAVKAKPLDPAPCKGFDERSSSFCSGLAPPPRNAGAQSLWPQFFWSGSRGTELWVEEGRLESWNARGVGGASGSWGPGWFLTSWA